MKHILIVGAKNSGKSSTIDAIVKELNPSRIFQIDLSTKSKMEIATQSKNYHCHNDTYVIEVCGALILVSAGAPTEQ